MIPYTPEELVAIAEREFAWCENEMKKASREMGFGDDWKKALEKVKTLHVEPGKQPDLIRDLAPRGRRVRATTHDLVTVPPLADDVWRMEMMSPERQMVNPFFLGGEVILVSYPTDTMSQEEKLMSMRGNNIHFSRATVFHELIPGHHLQGFMDGALQPAPRRLRHAVLVEGWALYWEMLLWDLGFPKTPENRVGMLFWRMHRCARIIFSLELPPGEDDAAAVHRLPGGPRRARARQRDGRGAPLLQRRLLAALPARVHDGRAAVPGAAEGARGFREDDACGPSTTRS